MNESDFNDGEVLEDEQERWFCGRQRERRGENARLERHARF